MFKTTRLERLSEGFVQSVLSGVEGKGGYVHTNVREVSGGHSQLEVNRGLPAQLLVKYFDKKGMSWQIKEELRNMVEFRQLNLAGSWPVMPKVDILKTTTDLARSAA